MDQLRPDDPRLMRLAALCDAMDITEPCPDPMYPGYTVEWKRVRRAVALLWSLHGGVWSCECAVCTKAMSLPGPWHARRAV
jgi:hypothetical protein